ncbi:MAG: TrmH family RNA methyltransferase [Ignavibacteriales bacterium]
MLYTSIDNKKIKEIKKLQTKKFRDEQNLFFIESEHLVLEAYKTGYLKELILEENTNFSLDIETMYVSSNVKKYLSELESPSSVMGLCEKKSSDVISNHILIIDGVQDPGNLGTIIRSAVAFNIDTIILSNDTVDLYNSKVIRASQGMLFHTNIVSRDLLTEIPKLKGLGYEILGTRVDGGTDIKEMKLNDKWAIIMGNEGNGVKKEILDLCDKYLYIKMNKNTESLNVGVATSIILYELDK